ncbi:MAG: Asp/Glu racemase [Tateyamaria sp.]|uniref:maleate cis-trans isomerase family protein n=1 Tax=Tateyamaria sp. TaxID=1929288 RepID=UPI00329C6451
MTAPYTKRPETRNKLGLITLQSDRTIEDDFRRLMPADISLLVSRVTSGTEVSRDSLAQMENALSGAAALFPRGHSFDVVGYGCTSGTAQIGADVIADRVRAGIPAGHVTEPVSALIAACEHLGLDRIAIVSPYVASVSDRLRDVLGCARIETPHFISFDEANEEAVTQIDDASIIAATQKVMDGADVQAVFLSCTNLRTLDVIGSLQGDLGVPVLSSNLVLAWHMLRLAGADVTNPRDLL